MARPNLWTKSVPRVELDHRAHDARVGLDRIERLLAVRAPAASFWLSPFVRLLRSRAGGKERYGGRGGGSQSNPRSDCMSEIETRWRAGAVAVMWHTSRRRASLWFASKLWPSCFLAPLGHLFERSCVSLLSCA